MTFQMNHGASSVMLINITRRPKTRCPVDELEQLSGILMRSISLCFDRIANSTLSRRRTTNFPTLSADNSRHNSVLPTLFISYKTALTVPIRECRSVNMTYRAWHPGLKKGLKVIA